MVNHYTRRGFLEAVLGVAGSAALGACVPHILRSSKEAEPDLNALADQLEAQLNSESRGRQRLLDYEIEAAKKARATMTPELRQQLQFSELRKTPMLPRQAVVSYEVDRQAQDSRALLEQALPYVRDFYQTYGVAITFVPVEKLEPSMIKLGSTFGLTYAPLERLVRDSDLLMLGYYLFPHRTDKVARFVAGNITVSPVLNETLRSLDRELLDAQSATLREYKGLKGTSFAVAGRIFVRSQPSRGEEDAYLNVARTVAHELGHIWGLPHVITSSLDGTSSLYNKQRNAPGVNIMFVDPTATSMLPLQKTSMSVFLDPVQVGIVHNYFSGGVVFREVTASQIGYQHRLMDTNEAGF